MADTICVEKMISTIVTGDFWNCTFLGCEVLPHQLHAVALL